MNKLRIAELQAIRDDLARIKDVLGTLIAWMPQSADSPIRADEAETLLKRLLDELRRRMEAAGNATDSSHVAAVITRLMPFVQHTDTCLGARSIYSCECGAAKAMEDAKNIVASLAAPVRVSAEPPVKCPTCQSPQPYLHPSMQPDGGEVQPCGDAWHKTTPTNWSLISAPASVSQSEPNYSQASHNADGSVEWSYLKESTFGSAQSGKGDGPCKGVMYLIPK